jgi:hypothetical protein
MLRRLAALCLIAAAAIPPSARAWAPQAHYLLGDAAAEATAHDEASRVAAASGSLLADLDHALPDGTVIADTPAFAAALDAAGGGAHSGRFAAGWRAHVRAQDPGQGEISTRLLKLHADFIIVRTSGQQLAGGVFDAERIRQAARVLTGTTPSAADVERAAERLLVFAIVEGALLDMLPIQLDAPLGDLPPARSLMPPQLAHHERRIAESLAGSVAVLGGGAAKGAAEKTAAATGRPAAPCADPGLAEDLGLPPAPLLGLTVTTRRVTGGLSRTTIQLARPWMFRAAARVAIDRMGKSMFPTVAGRWNTGLYIEESTSALRSRLEAGAHRLGRLFP